MLRVNILKKNAPAIWFEIHTYIVWKLHTSSVNDIIVIDKVSGLFVQRPFRTPETNSSTNTGVISWIDCIRVGTWIFTYTNWGAKWDRFLHEFTPMWNNKKYLYQILHWKLGHLYVYFRLSYNWLTSIFLIKTNYQHRLNLMIWNDNPSTPTLKSCN